ncbi:hypothetical protein IFR04_000730 [Cadophora malorum]|uniref:Uncharacterized protein n=1 Tax=Cadophora malorum TaxID=108018 RepID=A0A8H8BWH0_9HELO|nr:hypothetical protein IFR04_000730 [Cadophora malorum]
MSSTTQSFDKAIGELLPPSTMEDVTTTQPTAGAAAAATYTPPPQPRPHLVTSSSSSSSLVTSSSTTSSNVSTPTNIVPPTPEEFKPHRKCNCHIPQLCPRTGHKIDVLRRTYPEPKEEINIEEALARGSLPGRYAKERVARKETTEEKMSEFERVKRELRGWKSA